jgi:nucleotide-binding universal stress UspA family protein
MCLILRGGVTAVETGTARAPCLVVGISRSRASWWALAWAVGEARRRGARLLVVNVSRHPAAGYAAEAGPGTFVRSPDPYADHLARGNALIRTAIAEAVGSMPRDISTDRQVISGRPAVELARLVSGSDLLVLGSRHRGWLRRLAPGSMARSVARRTRCPVVIVPEPPSRALPAPWTAQPDHGHWFHRGRPVHGGDGEWPGVSSPA